jgi:crotonobetainyl-CoA:carnitine CoA-transferase CaiB-like acyl-CoA transferase
MPLKVLDDPQPVPSKAPTVGEHTDEVLDDVLGYDRAKIADLRASGALGEP